MSELEGRHCRLAVPDDWRREPPLGARQPPADGMEASVQVVERVQAMPAPAADIVARMRESFADLFEGGEVLAERAQPVAGGFPGHRLAYTFRDDDFALRRHDWVVVTAGPYVCEVTVERPAGSESCPDRLVDAILASLTLKGLYFCGAAVLLDLSARLRDAAPAAGERCALPFLGRSLALPEGWEPEAGGDGLRLRHQEAVLAVERVAPSDGDALAWLDGRLQALAREEHRVLATGQWDDDEGGEWAALRFEERELSRTWQTAACRQVVELFSGHPLPAVFNLRALPPRAGALEAALLALAASAEPLPEVEWRTRTAEPWLRVVLEGPWQHMDRGLYLCPTPPVTMLYALAQSSPSTLGVLAGPLLENARQGFGEVRAEEHAQASLRGVPALSARIDGLDREGEPRHLRAAWLHPESALYTCLVQSADGPAADRVAAELVNGLRVSGMEP